MSINPSVRFSPRRYCPVCGTGTKGCSATADGFHMCRGNPTPGWVCVDPEMANGEHKGYRHEDDDRRLQTNRDRRALGLSPKAKPQKPAIDWNRIARDYVRQFGSERRHELARRLGVPASALELIPLLGYCRSPVYLLDGQPIDESHWTCPETDATGSVIGIERRFRREHIEADEPDKKSILGGSRGIIQPDNWSARPGPALCVEGFSCVVAATAAGMCAVSRPSNRAGVDHLADVFRAWPRERDILIVGENDLKPNGDWPGRNGALSVATQLAERLNRAVKWALPPEGFKDSREYLRDGGGWDETPWVERGQMLLAHLLATAQVVGIDPVSTETPTCQAVSRDTPTGPPEPCPYQASRDMRDELKLCVRKCPSQSPVRFEKKGVCFVCNRDCGNGSTCRPCLEKRLHNLLRMSDSYIIRTSVEAGQTDQPADQPGPASTSAVAGEQRRVLFAAFKATGPTEALKKAVKRRGGERVSVLTDDAEGVAAILSGDADVSRFLLKDREQDNGEIGTSEGQGDAAHLWILSLPAGVDPPAEFHRVSPGAAIRALHHAVKTVPSATENVTRYKPTHKSEAWGDEEEKEPTDTKCLGPSAFTVSAVREVLQGANVPVVTVQFDGKRSQSTGVGWSLPDLQSAALNMWIGGTASPSRPTVERVVELAQFWLPKLAALPRGIGQGKRVAQVLREHLWYVSLYEIDQQLKDADEQDKAEDAFTAEASSLLAGLRAHYRGREHEAGPVVRLLLA